MLLVRDVSGPAKVVAGEKAVFRATTFNMSDPPQDELAKINWIIKSGGEIIEKFNAQGVILEYVVPQSLLGKTIQTMPFRNSPASFVSVLTQVVNDTDVVSPSGGLTILSREDWGARTDLPRRGRIVDPTHRTEVFIHHTVIPDNDVSKNEWESLDEVKAGMRKLQTVRAHDLGADVPYNMVAFCMANGDLVLGEGRGIHRSGAHTIGHNRTAIAVSFQGNFEDFQLPTHIDSQLAILGAWLRRLHEQEGFVNLGNERPLNREVFAHRDVKATDCCGKHLFRKLDLIHFL